MTDHDLILQERSAAKAQELADRAYRTALGVGAPVGFVFRQTQYAQPALPRRARRQARADRGAGAEVNSKQAA